MVMLSPARILFTRDEVIFMIAEILPLESGMWILDSDDNYTGKRVKHCAPFEGASIARAELEWRLKLTRNDGLKLVDEIQNNPESATYSQLTRESKNALNYISGVKRREVCYYMWLFTRKYTMKGEKCQCGNRTWRKIGGVAKACFKCGRVKNL